MEINFEKLQELIDNKDIPELLEFLDNNNLEIKDGKIIGKNLKEIDVILKSLSKDPKWSFFYARNVIKGRFPEGEAALASEAEYAYRYAVTVINGRFPEGEAAIATDPKYAFLYALYIIKGRWPEGEAAIKSDPDYSGIYKNL